MTSNWSRDEVDDVQTMSEDKDNGMDGKTCFGSCQDSDVDGKEFPRCEGSVDLLIKLLSLSGVEKASAKISAVDFTACWMCSVNPVGLSIAVGVSLCFIGLAWYQMWLLGVVLYKSLGRNLISHY